MVTASKNNGRKIGVRQVLLGSIFLNKEVLRWLPYVGLVAVMGLLMISNRFKGEKTLRQTVVIQEVVKDLRSESSTVEAELMNRSRYSNILREVEKRSLGLKRPSEPPIKIRVKK